MYEIVITSRKQLKFYLQADMMMNRGYFKVPLKKRFIQLFLPDYIMGETVLKVKHSSVRIKNSLWLVIEK